LLHQLIKTPAVPADKKRANTMKKLNKKAARVFNAMIKLMGENDHLKIDNTNGTFMPVVIEKVQEVMFYQSECTIYSVAHYFEQNGDLVPDPEMTFLVVKANTEVIYPATFQNQMSYQESLFKDGVDWKFSRSMQSGHTDFANMWMGNIKEQQNL
jgi:hypothetical protein